MDILDSTRLSATSRAEVPKPDPSQPADGSLFRRSPGGVESARSCRRLFLDDDPARAQTFLDRFPEAVWVQTVSECLTRLIEVWDEVHLDHDLGGKTYVDTREIDCGMEVIRWLCKEPRLHLRATFFYIHTHNTLAGLLMVLQMRESGYQAEFRPFGFDFDRFLASDGRDDIQNPAPSPIQKSIGNRWLQRIRGVCNSIFKRASSLRLRSR